MTAVICPEGCTVDHHDPREANEPEYHERDLGFGIFFSYCDGEVHVNWMPDWCEWIAEPHEVATEFEDVRRVLASVPDEFAKFAAAFQTD